MSLQNAAHVYHGKVVGAGGGSSDSEAIFQITLTGSGPYVVDKTPAEVDAALMAGKVVKLNECDLILVTPTQYEFGSVEIYSEGEAYGFNVTLIKSISDNSAWTNIVVTTPSVIITGKADKVSSATSGNFAGLDANGNLTDSGKKASDFMADGTVGVAKGGTGQTTLTSNAVITGNGTSAVKQVATASGALYATAANGAASFGTLPVAQGGTGATSLTSGAALIGSGTNAVTTRSITNNTSKSTAPSGSTNLATMNSLLYGMQNYLNRTSDVNSADTNYGTAMARAIYATTTDLTPGSTVLRNGCIALVYEA